MTVGARQFVTTSVQRYGDRPFLLDSVTGRQWSYREFCSIAESVAAFLSSQGLQRKERVAVVLPNCPEYPLLYFALMFAGLTAVPIPPTATDSDIDYILGSSRCSAVLTSSCLTEKVSASEDLPAIYVKLASGDQGVDLWGLEPQPEFTAFQEHVIDDIAVIMHTSGTTAKPKGVAHRLESLFHNAAAFAAAVGLDHNARFLDMLPMSYMAGFLNLMLLPFVVGASMVSAPAFDARSTISFWDVPKRTGVNALWFTPTILALLLRGDRGSTGEEYSRTCLEFAFVGTAPLPRRTRQEFEARYGIHLLESYGLSETLFVTTRAPAVPDNPESVGRPVDEVKVEVVTGGESARPGDQGEILVRTPDMMAGYVDPRTGDVEPVEPGAPFRTGDIGSIDESGSLVISGRIKDLIIRGGVNISPKAIEETLAEHPDVAEVAVVGVPHELYGEDVVAVVSMVEGSSIETVRPSLVSLAREKLAAHQQPAHYLEIDAFPIAGTGKIHKGQLRELVFNKLGASRFFGGTG